MIYFLFITHKKRLIKKYKYKEGMEANIKNVYMFEKLYKEP